MIVWIVGLSSAGKTSVGRRVVDRWRAVDPATVLVDGDAVRAMARAAGEPTGHDLDGRRLSNRRTIALAEWLDAEGLNAVCCQVTFFPEHREAHHATVSDVVEVHLDVPLDVAQERDDRGVYDLERDVAGVDLPFHAPPPPALVLDATGGTPDELASKVLAHLGIDA